MIDRTGTQILQYESTHTQMRKTEIVSCRKASGVGSITEPEYLEDV